MTPVYTYLFYKFSETTETFYSLFLFLKYELICWNVWHFEKSLYTEMQDIKMDVLLTVILEWMLRVLNAKFMELSIFLFRFKWLYV